VTSNLSFENQRAQNFFLSLSTCNPYSSPEFTHTSLLAVRQLAFCSPRTTDLFPKAGCQNLSTRLSLCQPSQEGGSFLLQQKGATPSFLWSHTDQKQRGRVKAPRRTGSAKTGSTITYHWLLFPAVFLCM